MAGPPIGGSYMEFKAMMIVLFVYAVVAVGFLAVVVHLQ